MSEEKFLGRHKDVLQLLEAGISQRQIWKITGKTHYVTSKAKRILKERK